MQPVGAHEGIRRTAHHHAIRRKSLQFIVVDDGPAGVFRDDSHRGTAVYAVAADHTAGSHEMHVRLVRVDEIVALHEHRDVAGHDAGAVFRKSIVVYAYDIVVRIGRTAHRPQPRILVFGELVPGHHGIVT